MQPDIIIIGSGMGGATLAAGLAASGRRVLILERGVHLKDSPEARDPTAIFRRGHFKPDEVWHDADGRPFNPGNFACVGGNTKFYGAVLLRYREADFSPLQHMEGSTPGWPIRYDDLEPFYSRAEALYRVRGDSLADPTEPPHSAPYPFPPVPDEPDIATLRQAFAAQGLHVSPLPLGVDIDRWLARAPTTWDAFPDTTGAKSDAESCGLAEALRHPNVTLLTGAKVTRLQARGRRVTGVEVERDGRREVIPAPLVCLCAGAVMSAALLLASASDDHSAGLANRSDQVGRNFMNHNLTGMVAYHPFRRNRTVYEKTIQFNDWDLTGGPGGEPLGNVQMLGRITGPILAGEAGLPLWLARHVADRSIHIMAMSEDLPDPASRVLWRDGGVVLDWKRTNVAAHDLLVRNLRQAMRRAGWPVVLSRGFPKSKPSHQCGTARMGADPATSVVDVNLRAHDLDNLYLVDASVLPTSAAVNPSLTVAALALRAAQHIQTAGTGMIPLALVTGGQQGIGLGIATALAEAGFRIAIASLPGPDSPQVRAALGQLGPATRYFQHDLAQADAAPRLIDGIEGAMGPISALVQNAGVAAKVRGDMLQITPENFDHVTGINLRGAFFLAQAVARRMVARTGGPYRSITFITSVSAGMASVERADYCISKAGAAMAAQALALRLAPHGIGVFELRPGIIETAMTAAIRDTYTDRIEGGLVPAGRWGQPPDIGAVMVPIATGQLAFATGAVIPVDGGLSIHRL